MPHSARGPDRLRESMELPPGVSELRDVFDGKAKVGSLNSFFGIVRDARAPIPTAKTDYKCEITMYDRSLEDDNQSVRLNVFAPREQMPEVNVGDVLFAVNVKVQKYHGPESLVTHHSTTLHVYSAKAIPKPPQSAQKALTKAKKGSHVPTDKEHAFVSWLYHNISKDSLPDEAAFQHAIAQSMNVKDKFSLLQDVVDGRFYDILGRVVREPFHSGDRATLYVTDYTENANFFDSAPTGPRDPYGYTGKDEQDAQWLGPPGRRSIQVTCYEPHATVVQQEVQAGEWISLRNVQIKFGSNGRNLEGFLRGDQNAIDLGRTNVSVRDFTGEGDLDRKAKDALRRWREYEKSSKRKSGEKDGDGLRPNTKRKADGEGVARLNGKQRRKLKRQEAERKAKEDAAKADMRKLAIQDQLEVNQYIRCEGQNVDLVPISKICQPTAYETLIDGQSRTVDLPFICRKDKTIARVTDFRPNRLEDFACGRKRVAWDLLSDNSEDSASASDESADGSGAHGQQVWEWRFALELEDASSKEVQPQRIWVVVNNAEAQLLTDLDASNLRENVQKLDALREKMFTLWGNLEEHKAKQQARHLAMAARTPGDKPPLDDSDDEGDLTTDKVSNKPFMCCIQQYGVRLPEKDPRKAVAGAERTWQRIFAMFGTKISA